MANTSRIRGFMPINPGSGQGRMNVHGPYTVKASTAIYAGDVVARAAADDGALTPAAAEADSTVVGVAAETVLATDTDRSIDVWDDLQNMEFEVEALTCAATNLGQHANHVAGSGSTFATQGGALPEHSDTRGVSGHYLSGTFTDAIQQCQVMGLVQRPNNEWGAYAKVRVRFALSIYDGGAMA